MRNVALLLLASAALGVVFVAGCGKKIDEPVGDYKPTSAPPLPAGPDKLEIVDETVGTGPEAKKGDTVKVHYRGTLMNGREFDKSKEPFQVTIGQGQVIKGWDEGLPGMKQGGKRKLTIPWAMAYGENGSGDKIPPKAALKFDVELVEIVQPDAGAAPGASAAPAKPGPAAPKKAK